MKFNYLRILLPKNYIFKVAKEDDKLLGLNLTSIMNRWTRQMGHPVVTIQLVNSTTINITQTHFLLDQSSKPVSSPYQYMLSVFFKLFLLNIIFKDINGIFLTHIQWKQLV